MRVTSRFQANTATSSAPVKPAQACAEAQPPPAELRASSAPPSGAREVRSICTGVQLRAAAHGKGPGTAIGYAAVFEKYSVDLGGFTEKIARGAFAGVLTDDVRALKNHDSNLILARSTNGSLRMVEDELGLRVEIDLADTQIGRDTATEIASGLITGMSFAFVTDVDEWDYSGEMAIRTIKRFRELYDVGPVVYPAYTDTSVAMRSIESHRKQQRDRVRSLPSAPSSIAPPAAAPLSVYVARLKLAGAF